MIASKTSARTRGLRRIFLGPQFEDEDKTRTAQYLNVILIATMSLLLIRMASRIANRGEFRFTDSDTELMIMVAIMVIPLVLVRRGYVRAASIILLGIGYVGLVSNAALGKSPLLVYDAAFTGLFILIVGAGLLLGWRAVIVMAGLCILAGLWLARLFPGGDVTLREGSPTTYANDVAVMFILVALVTYFLITGLRQALHRSRVSEQSLQEQNLKLTNLQSVLEERVAERTAQLQTAAEVSQAAASILEPNKLVSEVVGLITERFGVYYAAVFMLDNSGSYLILREATGEAGRVLKERGHRLRVGPDSMVGYAALKREPRIALRADQDATRFANPLLPNTQSEIALPLLVGDQVLGALDVQAIQADAFDETAIATLQNVAAQIAIALQNAQSYQRLQETLNYTTRQYELSRTIFTAGTPTAAYESLGQVFAMLSGIDRVNLLRVVSWDAAGQPAEYELVTEWDVLGGAQSDTGVRYSVAETPLAQLITENEAVVIRDAKDSRLPFDARQQLAQAGVQAALLVPLVIQNQFAGFIAATAEQPHDFEESEIRLLKSAAEQLGVVLNNLQLNTEMQQTLERVAQLNRRLSGESWSSYLTSRDEWLVESGHVQPALTATSLQVPITVRGETIGTFNVADAKTERQWQEEELTMLQTIAGEVALAIENARLIEQTQRAARREKDIADAADKIHRSVNLDAILHTAVEEVMRIAGTTEVAIQIGRPEAAPGNGQRVATS